MPNWWQGQQVHAVSLVMTERLRHEVDRSMALADLYSFINEFFNHKGSPTQDEFMYVVQRRTLHFEMDGHGRIALTAKFAYSDAEWVIWHKPWLERKRLLAHEDPGVAAWISRSMTKALRQSEYRMLRTYILYYHVRTALCPPEQPPTWDEYWHVLINSQFTYRLDSFGFVNFREDPA
jgi:hypothetical protein